MKNWTNLLFRSAICLVLATASFTSCYNDDALWDKIYDLEYRLDSLQQNLNDQATAMNALIKNKTSIKACVRNPDGSYVIELADGTKFTVMPEGAEFSSLVSCVTIDGKQYWATYDQNGNLNALVGASGKKIPMENDIKVEILEGKYVLVINGEQFVTGYDAEEVVQVFSSCTPLKDASEQVYAVKFTMGDGWEITVAVDGYKGVIFKLSDLNTTVLSEYFVDYGTTQSFLMETQGVVDYIMQIPDGWRVEEKVQEATGELYVHITAPSKETVAMGAGVVAGDLKVVSVVEGGKAAVTKLTLSADPFKTYNVSSLKAVVDVYTGIQKFVYGFMLSPDFDEDQVVANITTSLTDAAELPQGYYLSEVAIDKTYKEIYPELVEGGDYVFWVVPVLYEVGGNDNPGGYFVKKEMIRTYYMVPTSLNMELGAVTLLDATIKVEARGIKSVFAGLTPKTENTIEEIVYQINNGVYDPIPAEGLLPYEGPVSQYPEKDFPAYMDPATSYVAWVVVVEDEKTEYVASDVIYKEFTTLSIQEGGSLAVTAGTPVVDASSISYPVSCEDAAMIYYAYLDSATGSRYSGESMSNTTKWNQLLKAATFQSVRGSSAEAAVDGLLPETEMWLYVAPVGHDGLYGKVTCEPVSTKGVTFNNLAVTVETVEVLAKDATFKITTDGDVEDYVYWVGKNSDPFWVLPEFCGSDLTQASKYIAANPDADQVVAAMKQHGKIADDGTLVLKELEITKEYVLLVLAKDASGNYSLCTTTNGYKHFKTEAIDFGDDFTAANTPKWIEVKKMIENGIEWHKNEFHGGKGQGQGFASYAFSINIPAGLTAYISCFQTYAEVSGGSLADIMVELEEECTDKTSVGKYVIDPETGEAPRHPDWYDDKGKLIQGSQVNVYTMYVHGNPEDGQVTFFAADAHGEVHCPTWADGKCSNYEYFLEEIRKMKSYDYWREYIIDFGNYSYNGDPYHEYSRILKDEAKIDELAKKYVEIYSYYYADAEPLLFINNGQPLKISNRQAMGVDETGKVLDRVYVMLKDLDGNYFEPMTIEVPNYYK